MPRTKSILLFGEGKTEAVFLAHLRDLYRVPEAATKVDCGRGGSRRTVVLAAINAARLADYSGVLILLDSDRDDEPIPAAWCHEYRLSIETSNPCLEALMLDIVGDGNLSGLRHGTSASDRCKSHFQNTYLKTDRSGQVLGRLKNGLPALLPKALLEEAKSRIPVLGEIIRAIRGEIC